MQSEQANSIQGKPLSVFKFKSRYTEAEWVNVTYGMDLLEEYVKEKGMKVCYHHHVGTGI